MRQEIFCFYEATFFSKFGHMEFKRFEALIEMFPQVQIFSTEGEDLDRVITHFLNQQENVSTMSEAMQRKIQHALAPFFQQRFISLHDEEAPLVRHLLLKKKFFLQTDRYIDDMAWPETDPDKLEEALKIADLTDEVLERKLLSLSNGELRRVLLARMWMEKPEWVYFNDLFGGLDPEYRRHLAASVVQLSKRDGLKVAVRLAREDELLPEIPAFVYANKTFTPYAGELPQEIAAPKYSKKELKGYEIVSLKPQSELASDPTAQTSSEILFELKNVNVRFGETDVLKNLNWTVRKGEHWAVMGGPGHGLNIWDHKAKLGFFSPELALQYREDLSLSEVLCTGFTANLCKADNTTWEERAKAKEWLNYLGFEDVNARYRDLSPIDKRVVLMARAAIRPPKVLLLDEPTQGLKGEYRDKIFSLLQLLSKETTIILVSHYEEEWPPCMTHLLRMPKFSGT